MFYGIIEINVQINFYVQFERSYFENNLESIFEKDLHTSFTVGYFLYAIPCKHLKFAL